LPAIRYRPGRQASPRAAGSGLRTAYLFQGCLVKYFFPRVRDSVRDVLARFGYRVVCPEDQACCGAPSLHLGCKDDVLALADINLRSFEREKPEVILTVCPTGHSLLKKIYPQLRPEAGQWADRVFDFTEFMVGRGFLPRGRKPAQEAYLLEAAGYKPRTEKEPFTCCGFCGVFSLKNPALSALFWKEKEKRILDSRAKTVVTDCPGCLFQMTSRLGRTSPRLKVRHSAEILADGCLAAEMKSEAAVGLRPKTGV
jgi:Fe-S oxidoreductase